MQVVGGGGLRRERLSFDPAHLHNTILHFIRWYLQVIERQKNIIIFVQTATTCYFLSGMPATPRRASP